MVGENAQSTTPTTSPTKPKTTLSMDKMINQIAESVANDMINKIEHKNTTKPTIKPTPHTKKTTIAHPQKKHKPTKAKLSDQGFIKKEFSTLLSKLDSVKEAVSNSKLPYKTNKTVANQDSNAKPKTLVPKKLERISPISAKLLSHPSDSIENPLISEAVKLLKGLSNSGTARPTTPSSSHNPSLKKAVDLLKKVSTSNSIASEHNSKLQKAVNLLRDLQTNGHSQPSKEVTAATMNKPSNNLIDSNNIDPSEPKSGLEKAIEILRNIQVNKATSSHINNLQQQPLRTQDSNIESQKQRNHDSDLQSQRPRKDENSSITTSIPRNKKTNMNPKLKEDSLSTAETPEIPEIDSMDSNDVIKTEEIAGPKSIKAALSKVDSYEHLIDTVAKEAAEEVEKSYLKSKQKMVHKPKLTEMPQIEPIDKPAKNGFEYNKDVDHSRSESFSKYGQSIRRVTIPTKSSKNIDGEDLGPETPSAQELRAMMKSRHQWSSSSHTLPALKKFDIPQETVGRFCMLYYY